MRVEDAVEALLPFVLTTCQAVKLISENARSPPAKASENMKGEDTVVLNSCEGSCWWKELISDCLRGYHSLFLEHLYQVNDWNDQQYGDKDYYSNSARFMTGFWLFFEATELAVWKDIYGLEQIWWHIENLQ